MDSIDARDANARFGASGCGGADADCHVAARCGAWFDRDVAAWKRTQAECRPASLGSGGGAGGGMGGGRRRWSACRRPSSNACRTSTCLLWCGRWRSRWAACRRLRLPDDEAHEARQAAEAPVKMRLHVAERLLDDDVSMFSHTATGAADATDDGRAVAPRDGCPAH